jgi:squalene-associated FAD-dependent desaturase
MKVVVVGGGIAGLAAATRLVDGGHEVTLFERRATLGGRAFSVVDETTGDVIDNGQHLFMGCYRALRAFLERIGSAAKLRFQRDFQVSFLDDGTLTRLKAVPVPGRLSGGLHLAGGLLGFSSLTWADRLALVKVAAGVARPSALFPAASDFETVERWLDRVGQSRAARRGFWHPLALAALNDDPRTASAKMLEAVLREGFFGTREGSRLGMASVGLSELYAEDAARYVEARGGRVVTAAQVENVRIEGRIARGVVLRDGTRCDADAVIAAVPPGAIGALLPRELAEGESYFAGIGRLESSPIVSAHVWLDRVVTDEELIALVDRPVHWVFNRNRLVMAPRPERAHKQCLALVVSCARELIDASAREIIELSVAELRRALPGAAKANVVHARVAKEREATIAHTAGTERLRPGARSPVDGLFLAGDYVRTGLPATLESAVRSADEAAELAAAYTPAPAPVASSGAFIPLRTLKRGRISVS